MEIKLCRICGKQDDSFVHIFKTDGLKNKIETCLPIVVTPQCPLPDIICTECLDCVDNFYSFIKRCLQNIIVLEAQYDIIESCLKTKRKVDKVMQVDNAAEILLETLTPYYMPAVELDGSKTPLFAPTLVDYECSSDSDAETREASKDDWIDEIVQRKCLKRKNLEELVNRCKVPRLEVGSGGRRKSRQPKKVAYHSTAQASSPPPFRPEFYANDDPPIPEQLLSLPADISITREPQIADVIQPHTCLLCEQSASSLLALATHMYEIHGIDLAQVYAGNGGGDTAGSTQTHGQQSAATRNRKIPELVKISEVIRPKKETRQEYPADPPILEPQIPTTIPLFRNQYTCSDCPPPPVTFHTFKEYSTHRRSQHQIFHCDLCPKYYGRNSHLWKHVNRVHKGHPSITCQQCYKTSASKYHLAQHFNKMHSTKTVQQYSRTYSRTKDGDSSEDDDSSLLTQKFEGFDFKSVRQSFLKQELLTKRHKYVSILKRKPQNESSVMKSEPKTNVTIVAPKEIDASSDLYTNIITNYTPPSNEGPYKCTKCYKGFHKKNLLKKHKKNCRPRLQKDLLTRCKSCSRIFKDRQSLTKHLVNYHSEYTCEICHVAVQSKCEIVSHIRFTHPNSELVCYCGQILRSKSDLAKHKSDHRDSHVCQFCGDTLPTKIKLKMHILSLHRKILSLSCGICLKLFETQHILKDHVRLIHGDQLQPLTSCTVCGKNYGSKWKTYDHLNKSHGRIFRACKVCLDVFENERDLQTHFESAHLNRVGGNESAHLNRTPGESTPAQLNRGSCGGKNGGQGKQAEVESTSESDEEGKDVEFKPSGMKNGFVSKANANKLSLLEKRLLGKKVGDEEQKDHIKSEQNHHRNLARPKSSPEHDNPEVADRSFQSSDGDILQNSSKRTVYVNSNDPSLCEICLKVWPAKKHLWQHYIRCHKQVAATVCGICLKTNADYAMLQSHLRETHPHLLHGCGFGSNFICKICGRYHNASSKLKFHMAIHVGFDESLLAGQEAEEDNGERADDEQEEGETVVADDDKEQLASGSEESDSDTGDKEEEEDEDEDDDEEEDDEDIVPQEKQIIKLEELVIKTEEAEEDINYESLIEEVEASTGSEAGNEVLEHEVKTELLKNEAETELLENELETELFENEAKTEVLEHEADEAETQQNESISEDSDEAQQITDDELPVENELELVMLKNMIGENRSLQLQVNRELSDNDDSIIMDYQVLPDDDASYEVEVIDSCNVRTEVCSAPDDDGWMDEAQQRHFLHVVSKARSGEELDDAIRSISFDQCNSEEDEGTGEVFVEGGTGVCLNDNELETAVGSIL